MSTFRTSLSVNLDEIFQSLPKRGLHVHSVTWNGELSRVEIVWENPKLFTGRSIPVDYPLELLVKGKRPKGVRENAKVEVKPKPVVMATEPPKATPQNLIRTREDFDKAMAWFLNNPTTPESKLEYQGVEATWKPVTADHQFQEGYFYRKVTEQIPESLPAGSAQST